MAVYNIMIPVVALVDAESPEDAYQKLAGALTATGFEPYDAERDESIESAFESDEQDMLPDPLPGTVPQFRD